MDPFTVSVRALEYGGNRGSARVPATSAKPMNPDTPKRWSQENQL